MEYLYIFGSVILVSIISVLAALPLLVKKTLPKVLLLTLLSFSVGTLLGSVFIHFLPEAFHEGEHLAIAIYVLLGFFAFFILEKFIHSHHIHGLMEGHGHAYHLAPINLIGDGIHNFIDGMVIAGSYLVSIPLGIAATLSVMFHEIPQEIADFGVLLYAGMSKMKALVFNFLSAITAILGAGAGILMSSGNLNFTSFIVPFAAGNFTYIAASNLVPELHRSINTRESIIQLLAIIAGVSLMVLLAMFGPEHMH
ncbi:ZIP family metal transporter [Nanoarchaeota archaeon]